MGPRDSTQPLALTVEIDGEDWRFVLDYRAYTAIEEKTGVDMTTDEGQAQLETGGVELRRVFFHEGFKSGLYHGRKQELIEEGVEPTEARARAMERANDLGADVVMAELTPDVITRLNDQMDEITEAMEEAADDQEEMLEGEAADDPLARSASGAPAGS